jgi:hypothetical protein
VIGADSILEYRDSVLYIEMLPGIGELDRNEVAQLLSVAV